VQDSDGAAPRRRASKNAPYKGGRIDPHGFDAGKLIKGKKRHILVDTLGLLLHAIIHAADIQDRDGGLLLLATLSASFRSFRSCLPIAPIKARFLRTGSPKSCPISKPRSSNAPIKPKASCNCPSVGSSSAPSHV
jgi:hypothetical protein